MSSGRAVSRVIRHYQSLFTLSTLPNHLIFYYILSIPFTLSLSFLPLGITPHVALTLLILTLPLLDHLMVRGLLPGDELFTLRRILAVDTASLLLLLTPLLLISLFPNFHGLFSYALFLGLGFSSSIRLTVYVSLLRGGYSSRLLVSLYPVALVMLPLLGSEVFVISPLGVLPLAFFIPASLLYLSLVNRMPIKIPGVNTFNLVRGYTYSWVLDDPEELDGVFEKVSKREDLTVDMVHVKGGDESFSIWAPRFHFGPLRNVGSSVFPSLLKRIQYGSSGLPSTVLHTPTSHVYDLPSNRECERVVKELVGFPTPSHYSSTITRLVKIARGKTSASAFAFGKTALLALSFEEMEDIPEELASKLREYGEEVGFEDVVVVDSHNSLSGITEEFRPEEVEELFSTGAQCLQELREEAQGPFEASLASARPSDIGMDDGMGSGGITVFMWRVFDELSALVVVDANNLSPRLRLKTLVRLRDSLGIEAEVLTTDTHEVTARQLVARGYVVLGETDIDEAFLSSLLSTCRIASSRLKRSEIGFLGHVVSARILGEEGLSALTLLTERAFSRAKVYALLAYGLALILSLSLLL
ncbi:MAG: DUF2070 family protein [Candidatus Geothermarchaeales archaeon]